MGITDRGVDSMSEERLNFSDGLGTLDGKACNLESLGERMEVEVIRDFTVPDAWRSKEDILL